MQGVEGVRAIQRNPTMTKGGDPVRGERRWVERDWGEVRRGVAKLLRRGGLTPHESGEEILGQHV